MEKVHVTGDMQDFEMEIIELDGKPGITIKKYNGEAKKVIIPASVGGIPVTVIGDSAFWYKEELTEIVLPEGIHSIERWAFHDCEKLSKINLPEGLSSIGDYVFEGCTKLGEIILPESLSSIGDDAFKECKQLKSITLPKGIIEIGYSAFDECAGLTEINVSEQNSVYASVDGVLFDRNITTLIHYPKGRKGAYAIPDTVLDFEYDALNDCKKLTRINIPQSVITMATLFGCGKLANITVNNNNGFFSSIDGILFNKEGDYLYQYPSGRSNTDYTVPDRTASIASNAFNNCKGLSTINLPDGLKYIYHDAFSGCEGLCAITLPVGLVYIGEEVFERCPHLETVTLSRKTKTHYKAFKGFSGKLVYID